MKAKPGAIKRLGARVFLKVPLYKAKRQYKVAYLNHPLFEKLFGKASHDDAVGIVQRLFNTTIEKDHSTGEKLGEAWCDRQHDPLGLSLSGNLGSGRAYYMGKCFNIKGEKTPLARSEQRRFSDGLLEMERAIWETNVANALQGSISTGLNNVLAILDMDEECSVLWRDKPVHRAKIIRIDEAGELDRITHLFYDRKPLRKKALIGTAKAYGTLEADKFAERILHGSWSPGNISLKGHLIDFDTVCAQKGRAPLYSFTRWHFQNRFGFEIYGQLEVLRAIASDKRINVDKVSFDELQAAAVASLHEGLARKLLQLMGFKAGNKTLRTFQAELQQLSELWVELALKAYRRPESFSIKEAESLYVHVFDFSAFFRKYPLHKRHGSFTPAAAMNLLCSTPYLAPQKDKRWKLPVQIEYLGKLYAAIGEHFVTSAESLQMMQIAALRFVKLYDALHEKIAQATKADMKDVEARAYVVNEDRAYMFPAFTVSFTLAQNHPPFAPRVMQGLVEGLIASNRRVPDGKYMSDIRLYAEGYSYHLLDGQGHYRSGFHFFDGGAEVLAPKTATRQLLDSRDAPSARIKRAGRVVKLTKIL